LIVIIIERRVDEPSLGREGIALKDYGENSGVNELRTGIPLRVA